MATVKTAISLPIETFNSISAVARRNGRSRSGVIAEAIEDYLRDIETHEFINAMNASLEGRTPEEEADERLLLGEMGRLAVKALDAGGNVWED